MPTPDPDPAAVAVILTRAGRRISDKLARGFPLGCREAGIARELSLLKTAADD